MANILIVGLGYIGLALANELKSQEHTVWGVCRSPKQTDVHVIQADLFSLSERDFPPDLEYVFYMLSAGERTVQAYQRAYPQGVAHILKCLKGQKLKRFFYISSTRVYPQHQGEWVDEQTSVAPKDVFAKTLIEAENVSLHSPWLSTVVRLGGIYGPGRSSLLESVQAKCAFLSDKPIFTNRIHQHDAVQLLVFLLAQKDLDTLYNGVDNHPALYNEVIDWLAQRLEVAAPIETKEMQRDSKRVSNVRLRQKGYAFIYPTFQEGYEALIQNGALK